MHTNGKESVTRWISVLHRQFQIYLNRELKNYDFHSSDFVFLVSLSHDQGVSQEELSSHLYIDKAATARAIQKLERLGYVQRMRCAADKRKNLVQLTDKGARTRDEIKGKLMYWNNRLTSELSDEERTLMLGLIKRMSQIALIETNRADKQ